MENKIIQDNAIGRLILSRLEGTISSEDNAVLGAWLEASAQNRQTYAEYAALKGLLLAEDDDSGVEAALEQVRGKARMDRKSVRKVWLGIGVAAAAVALLVLGLHLKPSGDAVENTVYKMANVDNSSMHVNLPDGTDVWLRPGSEIRYDESFGEETRSVALKGEAYFDVKKDTEHPFYVNTEGFRVRVLGTAFNVKSVASQDPEVTLARGSVAMQTPSGENLLRLQPGQKATWNQEDGMFGVCETSVTDLLLVNYGILSLSDVTLPKILDVIRAEYGVHVVASPGGDNNRRYNFNFQKGASVASVVDLLGFICNDQKFSIVE